MPPGGTIVSGCAPVKHKVKTDLFMRVSIIDNDTWPRCVTCPRHLFDKAGYFLVTFLLVPLDDCPFLHRW